nr:capsular polysaccharide biosynthesis protein [Microbulbifer sp. GX H0434]
MEVPCRYFVRRPGAAVSAIAGWGLKPTANRARRIAAARKLPYIAIEDGFLRSLDLGVAGAPAHSVVVDFKGIYYDATRPSDLETLILEADFGAAELARARDCMALLRQHRLSKYNCATDRAIEWPDARPRVLVVDQTFGDASVVYGGADERRFVEMLDAAQRDNPHAEVCVKVHPDVVAGKKRGYLLDAARQRGCRILAGDIAPWALLDAVESVYAVTSQLGFEALLAGRKVHCFGLPFYAGWGLTDDVLDCRRRNVARSLEQLFAAAYLRYSRYINPYTGERCELEDTIRLIAEQKRLRERFRGPWAGAGFSAWKRRFVPGFLGKHRSPDAGAQRRNPGALENQAVQFIAARASALARLPAATRVATQVVTWASGLTDAFAAACDRAGLDLWQMEDGFLRSVGLGADLVAPLSLVLDSRGIYYDARSPSDLETILRETQFDAALLARARRLRETLVRSRLSKYNVGTARPAELQLPAGRRVILVPGQVESDASIAGGSPALKSNHALLRAVRAGNPDALIVYKPHPDVVVGARLGALPEEGGEPLFDRLVTDIAMPQLLEVADEVHTLCSLSGFEALLRGLKVVTYGLPFYAGWGLSEDLLLDADTMPSGAVQDFDRSAILARRGRQLHLDALVAGALILYPVYCDPESGDHIDVETAVRLLQVRRHRQAKREWGRTLYRLFRNRFLRR